MSGAVVRKRDRAMSDHTKANGALVRLVPAHRRDTSLPPTAEPDGQLHRPGSCSPYCMTAPELIAHFGDSARRLALLGGFLEFRAALRGIGFNRGYHWIGGSFVCAGADPT